MRLVVRGWSRNMGDRELIEDISIENIEESEEDHTKWQEPLRSKKKHKIGGYVEVRVGTDITLSGAYKLSLQLPEQDIAGLFTYYFGIELDHKVADKYGICMSKDLLRRELRKMTVGELFEMLTEPKVVLVSKQSA